MELQVLVATMGREDLALTKQMGLRQNAVIANQCGYWEKKREQADGDEVQMLCSDTVGVGVNRNIALEVAQGEILLFADDDIVYYDSDLQPVVDAFRELPDADVIFFAIDMTRNGQVFDKRRHKTKRLHFYNCLRYGACRMAIRKEAVEKHRLRFSTLFGGGSLYGSGEDTLFICDCLRAGLKLYSHEYVLGACAKDSSSWFTGYNEKYCFDQGALLSCAFPKSKHLMKWYFGRKIKKRSGMKMSAVIKEMDRGIKAYGGLRPYTPRDAEQKGE